MPAKLIDQPLILPDVNEHGLTALRQWRLDQGITSAALASKLEISVATLYRYESGMMDITRANNIVKLTRGAVRYRDLIGGFKPEYA